MLDLEARCVVNEILEYFFLKSCEIAWVLVFRRHHLGFRCSWQNKRFDRVLKREIGHKRVFFCDYTGRFVSDLVGNPEDRFSRVAAHFTAVIVFFSYFGPQHKSFVLLNRLSMSNEYPQTMLWSINKKTVYL